MGLFSNNRIDVGFGAICNTNVVFALFECNIWSVRLLSNSRNDINN